MRSWVILIASIITADMPGAPSLLPKICRCNRCTAARPLEPGNSSSSCTECSGSARTSWSWITLPLPNTSLLRLTAMTMRAPSARQTETGIGLTSAPSISQRPLICTGRKMPGSANDALSAFTRLPLLSQTSCPVPSSVATATNLPLQLLDVESCEMMLEPCAQALSGDQARAGEIEVEKAEDAAPSQAAGEILERVKPPVTKQAPATAPIDVPATMSGSSPASIKALQHADMGPAAGRAAAEGDPNFGLATLLITRSLMPGKIRQLGRKRPGAR